MNAAAKQQASPRARIMVIDDEPAMGHILAKRLTLDGYAALAYSDPSAALAAIPADQPDLILTDVRMPGLSGKELLRLIKRDFPLIPVLVMSAYGTIEDAVAMLRGGAYNYITKPFQHDDLAHQIELALDHRNLEREVRRLSEAAGSAPPRSIVGASKGIESVRELIRRAAHTDSAVLITGESGVGKELVAREIHRQSARGSRPFVAVNCPAIPSALIESELFGHEKGAFTGADHSRLGVIESSAGGTLFLDEIGELPVEVQAKLLRVLQEHEVQRLGGLRPIPVDLRIIAATNRDLEREVKARRFRADLYYRLKVIIIRVPPLRERLDDIPELARHLAAGAGRHLGKGEVKLAPEVIRRFQTYSWPGNIREMENVITRLLAMNSSAEITGRDLPADLMSAAEPSSGGVQYALPASVNWPENYLHARDQFERSYLKQLMRISGGKMAVAARISGLSRRHLYEKFEKLGMNKEELALGEETIEEE
ncbi:sigma-54-dependent Fis family transcriptional regulator [Candidatus Sumerlaeota bacterium]|nr:sigma-54-dependent Fis family transcriptional regulator [Candidatus Sumerlaeota bacterium]